MKADQLQDQILQILHTVKDDDEEDGTMNLRYETWEKCITVEPRESRESFAIMEDFVSGIDDKNLKNKLINALSNRKSFANFKMLVEQSKFREQWLAFKQQKLEEPGLGRIIVAT